MTAWLLDAGPSVATILVLLIMYVPICLLRSLCLLGLLSYNGRR
jgi:hypothetical protein